jgi:hypothetical protein
LNEFYQPDGKIRKDVSQLQFEKIR